MHYRRNVLLKNGALCLIRHADRGDAEAVLDVFQKTHAETDFLLSYPDENAFTPESEAAFLSSSAAGTNTVELIAVLNGSTVGCAGISPVGAGVKVRHRAAFGVSVLKAFWGLGIGRALTECCIECAKTAGYQQLELEVVAENQAAVALYKRLGFTEYGRNPKGFRSRLTGWQELVLMRLETGAR